MSVLTTLEIPCLAKILSRCGITAFTDVNLRISTSGYLRSHRSQLTSSLHLEKDHRNPWIAQALATDLVIVGTFVEDQRPALDHGLQLDMADTLTISSTILSIPGN